MGKFVTKQLKNPAPNPLRSYLGNRVTKHTDRLVDVANMRTSG